MGVNLKDDVTIGAGIEQVDKYYDKMFSVHTISVIVGRSRHHRSKDSTAVHWTCCRRFAGKDFTVTPALIKLVQHDFGKFKIKDFFA